MVMNVSVRAPYIIGHSVELHGGSWRPMELHGSVPDNVGRRSVQYNDGFLPEIILLTLWDSIGEPF